VNKQRHRVSQARGATALLGIVVILSACTSVAYDDLPDSCTPGALARSNDPAKLRAISQDCASTPGAPAAALLKLNNLPPPTSPKVRLQPPVPMQNTENALFAADVFFNPLESYPRPADIEKLASLVDHINTTYAVRSISLGGSADPDERKLLPGDNVARKRAEYVLRYFQAAGLDIAVPVEFVDVEASQDNTPRGRAIQRRVEIEIHTLRKNTSAK
jgi:hypothetical protein